MRNFVSPQPTSVEIGSTLPAALMTWGVQRGRGTVAPLAEASFHSSVSLHSPPSRLATVTSHRCLALFAECEEYGVWVTLVTAKRQGDVSIRFCSRVGLPTPAVTTAATPANVESNLPHGRKCAQEDEKQGVEGFKATMLPPSSRK